MTKHFGILKFGAKDFANIWGFDAFSTVFSGWSWSLLHFGTFFAPKWNPQNRPKWQNACPKGLMEATARKNMKIVLLGTLSTCPNCMRGLRNRCFHMCGDTSQMGFKKHLFGRVVGSKTLKICLLRGHLKTRPTSSPKMSHFGVPLSCRNLAYDLACGVLGPK